MRQAILVDLDGTLALWEGVRGPYETQKCEDDRCNDVVRELIDLYDNEAYAIIIVTGRFTTFRQQTLRWLEKHDIAWTTLLMRSEGDYRPAAVVKEEFYQMHMLNRYAVRFVLEDHTTCVRMWRILGLTCLQVAETEF